MKVILYIVNDNDTECINFIKTLAKDTGAHLVVMGLLEKTNGEEKEKLLWQTLFKIQTSSSKEGIVTNVYFKRGELDTIVAAVQTLDVLLCAIPKHKACKLESEEFAELMKSVPCSFLLY